MKIVAVLFVLAVLSLPHLAQTVEALHSAARSAADERRYSDALKSLANLEQTHPQAFTANNYDYLAARLSEITGNKAGASAFYLAVIKRGSILGPYALFHLAAIARESGNLVLERTYLDEVTAFHPGSLVADAARNRRARSWFESGNYDQAVKAFGTLAAGTVKQSSARSEDLLARENKLLLARSLLLTGNTAGAREIFAALISTLANPAQPDDIALASVKMLDKLDIDASKSDRRVPMLNDFEHLRRASIYQFNRDFSDARLHYAAIIAEHPASGILPDAIFQTGRGFVQEGNFPEAVQWFERVAEQFPEHPVRKDAMLQAGSAYARMVKYREGIRRYQEFIAKYPDDEKIDRAYLNIIDILRDKGEEAEAKLWATRTQEVFRGKPAEAQALFADVKIDLAMNNWSSALAGLSKLATLPELGGSLPGGTNKPEVTFLRGFVLEQLREFPTSIETYLAVVDGRNEYYGWRATERLQAMAMAAESKPAVEAKLNSLSAQTNKDPEANRRDLQSAIRLSANPEVRSKLIESLRNTYSALPAYKNIPTFKFINAGRAEARKTPVVGQVTEIHKLLAEELAFLGLFDEAAPELMAAAGTDVPPNADQAYSLALMQSRGGRAYRAAAFAEPRWRSVPADYQVEMIPRQAIELLYPAPYADKFLKFAPPRNIDPRFLLSIVRQESRYRADIKSYAAARGMMQFISTTSEKVAAKLGLKDFDQDELYDPATAVLFGSQYTADLFGIFPDQPDAVAASYNGGEDNMQRWLKRSRSKISGLYVPEIAFSQTKDYVYKVMANYRIYRLFYDENLNPRQSVIEKSR